MEYPQTSQPKIVSRTIRMPPLDSFLLLLGTALLPVYLFGSGGIQPAHLVFACFAFLVLLRGGFPATVWSLCLLALFLHSFVVEASYGVVGGSPGTIIHSIYFFYNLIVTCAVYKYCRQNGLSSLVPGLLIASAIALGTITISGVDLREMGEGGRSTGTFNNPNQLGYFSVCLLSLTYLFYRNGLLRYSVAAGMFVIALFLSVASLSKAAIIANFLVIFFAMKPAVSRSSMMLWAAGIVAVAIVLAISYQRGFFDDYLFVQRLQSISNESDSSLAARGYFAFLEGDTIEIFFGLGYEKVARIVGHEVHSTLGGILNNYGIIGLLIFLGALVAWALKLWKAYGFLGMFCLSGPAMLYGITHNGVRFTIFWLLFAASLAMADRFLYARAGASMMRKSTRRSRRNDASSLADQ